jgi:hypothetical protein
MRALARLMAVAARTGFIGLVTNVACTQAPPGSLQEAENVVCRRPGAIEPRDGVEFIETTSGKSVYGFSTNDADIVVNYPGSTFSWRNVTDAVAIQYDDPALGAIDPQPFRRDIWSHAALRGNTYVPYEAGVLRLSADEDAFEAAGLPQVAGITDLLVSTDATWLANNEQVAYRVVLVRTDENGLVVSSAPTGASSVANTSGGTRNVRVGIEFSAQFLGLFDSVEIYRTRNFATGITIDDEMQLVGTVDVSLFGLVGGFYSWTFIDLTEVDARGKTLYTARCSAATCATSSARPSPTTGPATSPASRPGLAPARSPATRPSAPRRS